MTARAFHGIRREVDRFPQGSLPHPLPPSSQGELPLSPAPRAPSFATRDLPSRSQATSALEMAAGVFLGSCPARRPPGLGSLPHCLNCSFSSGGLDNHDKKGTVQRVLQAALKIGDVVNASKRCEWRKALPIGGLLLAGTLATAAMAVAATKATTPADANAPPPPPAVEQPMPPAPRPAPERVAAPPPLPGAPGAEFSPGVGDVLRLVNAKVDGEVIQAFVKNSPVAYRLGASEIVALKDRGVPSAVIAVMIQHGGELRARGLLPPGPPGANPPVPLPYPMEADPYAPAPSLDPGYDYGTMPMYLPYSYPADTYPYPYDYSYWYNSYPWTWASWAYWPFRYGSYPYRPIRSHYPYHYNFPVRGFGAPRTHFALRAAAGGFGGRSYVRSGSGGGIRSGGFGGGHGGGGRRR